MPLELALLSAMLRSSDLAKTGRKYFGIQLPKNTKTRRAILAYLYDGTFIKRNYGISLPPSALLSVVQSLLFGLLIVDIS